MLESPGMLASPDMVESPTLVESPAQPVSIKSWWSHHPERGGEKERGIERERERETEERDRDREMMSQHQQPCMPELLGKLKPQCLCDLCVSDSSHKLSFSSDPCM